MKHQVKICGLTQEEDVTKAIEFGAGYLGFIIEAKSPRKLTIGQAVSLFKASKGKAKRVAVTVNPDDRLLECIAKDLQPDFVQFHGDETVDRLASISKRYDFGLIKAMPIASDDDMKRAGEYSGVADFLLFDAKPPKGSDIRGGHGIAIDWTIIQRAPLPKFYALAGGLTPNTITDALLATNAPLVDVSSGVEQKAGIKDIQKMKTFIETVKHHR